MKSLHVCLQFSWTANPYVMKERLAMLQDTSLRTQIKDEFSRIYIFELAYYTNAYI